MVVEYLGCFHGRDTSLHPRYSASNVYFVNTDRQRSFLKGCPLFSFLFLFFKSGSLNGLELSD